MGKGRYYLMVIGSDADWVVGVRGLLFDNHERRLYFNDRLAVSLYLIRYNLRRIVMGRAMILIDEKLGKIEQVTFA